MLCASGCQHGVGFCDLGSVRRGWHRRRGACHVIGSGCIACIDRAITTAYCNALNADHTNCANTCACTCATGIDATSWACADRGTPCAATATASNTITRDPTITCNALTYPVTTD
jgi:hypothetical protein